MSVGTNIKKRRYELKMSQQNLADAMGYKTRSTIAKIEAGENDVSQKKLQKFAAVLHTSVEALISGYTSNFEPVATQRFFKSSNNTKNIVIILAGGKSGRSGQNIPSQFINVHGKPIIIHSMGAYQAHPLVDDIYIACLKGWEKIVQAYAEEHHINKVKGIITGGNSGIISLKNCYEYIKNYYNGEDNIIIQEATRPLVSVETISNLLQVCVEKNSATMCHYMKEYVQFTTCRGYAEYIDREEVVALQSPEAHSLALMKEVFEMAESRNHTLIESCFTMLLYNLGYDINFVESSVNNIKIVREEDIAAFAALIK